MAALNEDTLPDDPATLKAMLIAERARADRLAQLLKEMQRHSFGKRAESLPLDQLELGLEEIQQQDASEAATVEAADPQRRHAAATRRRTNRGALPPHLPRIETVVDVADRTCPWLAAVGSTGSERTWPNASTSCRRPCG